MSADEGHVRSLIMSVVTSPEVTSLAAIVVLTVASQIGLLCLLEDHTNMFPIVLNSAMALSLAGALRQLHLQRVCVQSLSPF